MNQECAFSAKPLLEFPIQMTELLATQGRKQRAQVARARSDAGADRRLHFINVSKNYLGAAHVEPLPTRAARLRSACGAGVSLANIASWALRETASLQLRAGTPTITF